MGRNGSLREYLSREIWSVDVSKYTPVGRTLFFVLRAILLAIKGCLDNQVTIWASALTYFTMMSLVPFLALIMGAGLRLGVPQKALDYVTGQFPEIEQVSFVQDAVKAFQGMDLKALGVIAILMLLYAMVKAVIKVEFAFNEIWGVEKGRSFLRRITNYVSIAVIGPLLVFSGMVLTASLMSSRVVSEVTSLPVAGWILKLLMLLLPYLAVTLALTFLYWLMPNTKVKFHAALLGALFAAVAWQLLQKAYLSAQVGISEYSVVYGAFAAIPIFLVWVYSSWIVVLVGAQICYGTQHAATYRYERGETELSAESRETTALRIALFLTSRFETGEPPVDGDTISRTLDIPARLVNQTLSTLVANGILNRLEEETYQVAKSPRRITAADVVVGIRRAGESLPVVTDQPEGAFAAIEGISLRSTESLQVSLAEMLEGPGMREVLAESGAGEIRTDDAPEPPVAGPSGG